MMRSCSCSCESRSATLFRSWLALGCRLHMLREGQKAGCGLPRPWRPPQERGSPWPEHLTLLGASGKSRALSLQTKVHTLLSQCPVTALSLPWGITDLKVRVLALGSYSLQM